jgi:hypothetical protein
MNTALAGTAPHAHRWWLIEDQGPWGPNAVKDHPSPHVASIRDRCIDGDRILLVRPSDSRTQSINRSRVWRFTPDNRAVHVTDLPSISRFTHDENIPWHITDDYPAVLVCTNGKRDACCAIKGNQLLRSVHDRFVMWECSHLGGHRFAPSVLFVPSGYVAGRVTKSDITAMSAHSPTLPLDKIRGLSLFSAPQQVADIVVRQHAQWEDLTVQTTVAQLDSAQHPDHTFLVSSTTNEAFIISLEQQHSRPLKESCISDPIISSYWVPVAPPAPAPLS